MAVTRPSVTSLQQSKALKPTTLPANSVSDWFFLGGASNVGYAFNVDLGSSIFPVSSQARNSFFFFLFQRLRVYLPCSFKMRMSRIRLASQASRHFRGSRAPQLPLRPVSSLTSSFFTRPCNIASFSTSPIGRQQQEREWSTPLAKQLFEAISVRRDQTSQLLLVFRPSN